MFQIRNAPTITPSSVEVTPLTRSAKILFRLRPGRNEIRKDVRFPDAFGMPNGEQAIKSAHSFLSPDSSRHSPLYRPTAKHQP